MKQKRLGPKRALRKTCQDFSPDLPAAAAGTTVIADGAYLGTGLIVPHRRRAERPLLRGQEAPRRRRRLTGALPSGRRPGCGPDSTAWSSTDSVPAASSTGPAARSAPRNVRPSQPAVYGQRPAAHGRVVPSAATPAGVRQTCRRELCAVPCDVRTGRAKQAVDAYDPAAVSALRIAS